jgi:hypothetical protein
VRSSFGWAVSVALLVLLAALPIGRTTCELLCAPAVHALVGDTAADEGRAASCHDSSDSLTPALAAVPAHGCGDHSGSALDAAAWLGGGRADAVARLLQPHASGIVLDSGNRSAWNRPLRASPPASPSSYMRASLASVVLRI